MVCRVLGSDAREPKEIAPFPGEGSRVAVGPWNLYFAPGKSGDKPVDVRWGAPSFMLLEQLFSSIQIYDTLGEV